MIEYTGDLILLIAIPFFILTMAIEWAMLRHRDDLKGYDTADSAGSLSLGVGYLLIASAWRVGFVAAYLWLYQHRVFDLQMTWPVWVVMFIAQDFFFYWYHRYGHELRLMWAGHINHHSSEHYNLSTALRQSWTEHFFGIIFWAPLALLGAPLEVMLIMEAVSLLYQYWLHTELVGRLGWFELVFNTPSHHRVHHGRNLQYMDRNYGAILIVWDRLFGTFEPEVEPVDYGITKPLRSHNPVVIAFHEWIAMGRDVARARSIRGALGAVFASPGWREDGEHETVKALMQRRAAQAPAE